MTQRVSALIQRAHRPGSGICRERPREPANGCVFSVVKPTLSAGELKTGDLRGVIGYCGLKGSAWRSVLLAL